MATKTKAPTSEELFAGLDQNVQAKITELVSKPGVDSRAKKVLTTVMLGGDVKAMEKAAYLNTNGVYEILVETLAANALPHVSFRKSDNKDARTAVIDTNITTLKSTILSQPVEAPVQAVDAPAEPVPAEPVAEAQPLFLTERFGTLTKLQKEAAFFATQDKTNKEIGKAMGCSESTVKGYLGGVFEKLGVKRGELKSVFENCAPDFTVEPALEIHVTGELDNSRVTASLENE